MAAEDERKLFVAGLPDSITEDVLRQLFEATGGTVVHVSLPRDRATGRPRGFGFVTLSSREEAAAARSALDGSIQAGRSVSVRPFQSEAPRRGDTGNRADRGERSVGDRAERDRGDRVDRDHVDRGERGDHSRGDRVDRVERSERPDRVDRSERPDRGGGGDRTGSDRRDRGDRTLYVGNLPYDCSTQDLEELFRERNAAQVTRIHLPQGPDGRPRGFGFVTVATPEDANRAIEALREADLRGRRLMVNIAHPRGERPERPAEDFRSIEPRLDRSIPPRESSIRPSFPDSIAEPPAFLDSPKGESRRRGERPEKKEKKRKRGASERVAAPKRGRERHRDWEDWDED